MAGRDQGEQCQELVEPIPSLFSREPLGTQSAACCNEFDGDLPQQNGIRGSGNQVERLRLPARL
jgi:hypothetical protein